MFINVLIMAVLLDFTQIENVLIYFSFVFRFDSVEIYLKYTHNYNIGTMIIYNKSQIVTNTKLYK